MPDDPFSSFGTADVRDLLHDYPLAWITARGARASSLLPLLGEYDADGRLIGLLGHMARRNPLVLALAVDPRAIILVTGPQGYVAPAQAERRDWGPTWNYAQLTIEAEVDFVPGETERALRDVTRHMEDEGWTSAELGGRYDAMAAAVIAFRAHVVGLVARFKLGQDEPPEVFDAIARNHPDVALVRWMKRFRPGA